MTCRYIIKSVNFGNKVGGYIFSVNSYASNSVAFVWRDCETLASAFIHCCFSAWCYCSAFACGCSYYVGSLEACGKCAVLGDYDCPRVVLVAIVPRQEAVALVWSGGYDCFRFARESSFACYASHIGIGSLHFHNKICSSIILDVCKLSPLAVVSIDFIKSTGSPKGC